MYGKLGDQNTVMGDEVRMWGRAAESRAAILRLKRRSDAAVSGQLQSRRHKDSHVCRLKSYAIVDLDIDVSQWYNEDDLDYLTPDAGVFDNRGTSPAYPSQPQRPRPGLPLLKLVDWDPNLPYDESPPTCIHYSIEWKLLLKKGRLSKLTNDTEENLVLAAGAFWDQTLKSMLQQLLTKKTPRYKCYEPDETNVVVSVTDRSERDLTKRFDELDIDWGVVEIGES